MREFGYDWIPKGLSNCVSISECSVVELLSDMEKPRLALPGIVNKYPVFEGSWRMASNASSWVIDGHWQVGISSGLLGKEASFAMNGSLVRSSSVSFLVVSISWSTSMTSISSSFVSMVSFSSLAIWVSLKSNARVRAGTAKTFVKILDAVDGGFGILVTVHDVFVSFVGVPPGFALIDEIRFFREMVRT